MTTPQTTAIQPKNAVQTFSEFLSSKTADLAKVAPRTLTAERAVKVAIAAYSRTPDLQECTTLSVYNAIHQAVQLGFEPGSALKHCYLVPFKNKKTGKKECQLIISYPGLIDLARRTGTLQSVEAHVVYENDYTEGPEFGLEPKFVHRPCLKGKRGAMLFVYALFRLKDGGRHLEVMTKEDVDAIRNRSASRDFGPWVTDYDEMAKKTVLKRGFKVIPMSIEVAEAIEADNTAEPIDVTPPKARPADAGKVVAAIREDDEPAGEPAADAPSDVEFLLGQVADATDAGTLREVGAAFEKARRNMTSDDAATFLAAFQAKFNAIEGK